MAQVTVDFVARSSDGASWSMVLVEQGPWGNVQVEPNLRRLQDRLYGCVDAALDGKLAEQFPESTGKAVAIRLDAYNVPELPVREFFERFSQQVLHLPEYAAALKASTIVSRITFELQLEPSP